MKEFFIVILFFTSNLIQGQPIEQKIPLTRILFVLDGSQSMLTRWETSTKMEIAQQLLTNMVDSVKDINGVEMGLRVYGHQKPVPPQDCSDTKLEVPFTANNATKIKNKLFAIKPKGTTPIAHSLELSANDFPECTDCRNIVILITDGIESCDGDPCAVSLKLQKEGIILKPFVIGIGLDEEFKQSFECIGRYYDATNENRFREVLRLVISQALNSTTVQVNLLNDMGKPTETNVNMTFYDSFSGERLYNFIHTINSRGNPDTLRLDPVPTYRVQVHTLPQVIKDSIDIFAGEHNEIEIPAAQGSILVKTQNSTYYKELQFLVKNPENGTILNVQSVDVPTKYLIGYYDVEILTIPRIIIEKFEVSQNRISTVQIPNPGMVTIVNNAACYGAIYKEEGNNLTLIYNLNQELLQQTVLMQPGSYRVISRPKNARESVFTSNIFFIVTSGSAQKINQF